MHDSIAGLLPERLKLPMLRLPQQVLAQLEEIRVREGRPLEIAYRGGYGFVSPEGNLTMCEEAAYFPQREDCAKLLDMLTHHSLYSYEEELRRGFITIAGGHRVGLAGRAVLEKGQVRHIRDISSFNIRVAREIPGCAAKLLPGLIDRQSGAVHHTLVVSPPQHGKTTLIRDLARLISRGEWPEGPSRGGCKVGIVDERSEIAGCFQGVPRFDLGPRTDVLDGCPKAEGLMMMIRSMSPDVVVVDEIGRAEDALALREAMHAGIRVIASAHGRDWNDLLRRPVLRELIRDKLFTRIAFLRKSAGDYCVESLLDSDGARLDTAGLQLPALKGG